MQGSARGSSEISIDWRKPAFCHFQVVLFFFSRARGFAKSQHQRATVVNRFVNFFESTCTDLDFPRRGCTAQSGSQHGRNGGARCRRRCRRPASERTDLLVPAGTEGQRGQRGREAVARLGEAAARRIAPLNLRPCTRHIRILTEAPPLHS